MQSTVATLLALLCARTYAAPGLIQAITETLPLSKVADPSAPQCRDGGVAHCCQATFTGSAAPITLVADLICYDLTPAVLNCVISITAHIPSSNHADNSGTAEAPIDPEFGCVGEYACCQVNDLDPLLGLFCTKPPGDCIGREGGDPAYCTDVIDGRFGNCTDNDIRNNRLLEGLGL